MIRVFHLLDELLCSAYELHLPRALVLWRQYLAFRTTTIGENTPAARRLGLELDCQRLCGSLAIGVFQGQGELVLSVTPAMGSPFGGVLPLKICKEQLTEQSMNAT